MQRRKLALILGSILVHAGVGFGLFVSGVWSVDRLDAGRQDIALAVIEPPAASGGPIAPSQKPKLVPKVQKQVVKQIVQPVVIDHDTTPTPVETTTGGDGGVGSGSGSGDDPTAPPGPGGGHCVGAACVAQAVPLPPPVIADSCEVLGTCPPKVVTPKMLGSLRYDGDTQPSPSDLTKQAMIRDDHKRSVGAFRVCLDANGAVSGVTMLTSTKYPDYDATITSAIHGWKYHPYVIEVNGMKRGVPACGVVTFIYSIK